MFSWRCRKDAGYCCKCFIAVLLHRQKFVVSVVSSCREQLFAGVADTSDKHKVFNISTNFRKHLRCPEWDIQGPGETEHCYHQTLTFFWL